MYTTSIKFRKSKCRLPINFATWNGFAQLSTAFLNATTRKQALNRDAVVDERSISSPVISIFDCDDGSGKIQSKILEDSLRTERRSYMRLKLIKALEKVKVPNNSLTNNYYTQTLKPYDLEEKWQIAENEKRQDIVITNSSHDPSIIEATSPSSSEKKETSTFVNKNDVDPFEHPAFCSKEKQSFEPVNSVKAIIAAGPVSNETEQNNSAPKTTFSKITLLKIKAAAMASEEFLKEQAITDKFADYYPGIERHQRKQEMLMTTKTLPDLLSSGNASIENINLLLKAYSLQGKLSTSLKIYDEAISLGFEVNSDTFVSLIQGAAVSRDPAAARMIYLKMRSRLISATLRVYGALIHAHVVSGDLNSGFALLEKIENERILTPNIVIYTILLDGLVNSGKHEEAWLLFREVRSWKLLDPDEVMFTVLIKSCAIRHEPERALGILDDMLASNCRPTDVTYVELIRACCQDLAFVSKAFELANQMKAEEMPLPIEVYDSLLTACSVVGDLSHCQKLLRTMQAEDIDISTAGVVAVIETLAFWVRERKKNPDACTSALRRTWSFLAYMKSRGTEITIEILNAVMSVYVSAGEWKNATEMLLQCATLECEPNSTTYEILLKMFFIDLKDPGRFFALWNHFRRETDIKPSKDVFHLAVEAAIYSQSASQTLNVLHEMYRMKVFPSAPLTAKLAKAGMHIPELTKLMMAFVNLQAQESITEVKAQNTHIDHVIEEHELSRYNRGETPKSLNEENKVRKEYYDKHKVAGIKNKRLPSDLHNQLRKKGGEYYAAICDKKTPNMANLGLGII